MSVFIPELSEDSQNVRRTRKKYHTKYNIKYKDEYPWALPSSKGDLYAFCHVCDVDISIKSVGAKGLRDHEATCRHSQKAHDMGLRSLTSSSVSSMAGQHQHHHPHSVFDDSQVHINSSVAMTTNLSTSFTSDISNTCSTSTSGIFIQPTHGTGQQQPPMGTVMNQSSLLSSSQQSLASSSYPVFEVDDAEMQPTCRSPQTSLTPNTPSSPLLQDQFVHKLNQTPSSSLQSLGNQIAEKLQPVDLHESLNCNSGRNHQNDDLGCPTIQHTSISANPANEAVSQGTIGDTRSESPSVEDLTCNICCQIFPDWKQLKKDLMEHIKDANAKKLGSNPSKIPNDDSKKKSKRQIKSKKQSPKALKEREISLKPKRGRPPGRKKKTWLPETSLSVTAFVTTQENTDNPEIKPEDADEPYKLEKRLAGSGAPAVAVPSGKPTGKRRGRPPKNAASTTKPSVPSEEGNLENCLPRYHRLPSTTPQNVFSSVELVNMCQQQRVEETTEIRSSKTPPTRRSGQRQCRVCRSIFFLRQDLKEHYQKEHNNGRPYWCESCDKFFTTKNNLEVHKKHKHVQGPNPCLCTICCKLLSSRTNLKIHMMIHKGERPFTCHVCNKSFSRKANMEMHMVYHTGERRFTCEICGQSFFAINALKRHKKLHSGEREYVCEVCNATYVTGTDLRRHRLKHEAVKPFPCTICDKQFTRSHDLKVHLRYHNKEIRFTCNVCGKQFVESGNYRRHMRRHTGERPYSCVICNQSFSQAHHYKVHVRTSHADQAESLNEWSSTHGRPTIHRNPPLNQRVPPIKRTQKLSANVPNPLPPNPVISHQLCPPVATTATTMNSVLPEHVHNIQTVHIHNTNNVSIHNPTGTTTIANITPISSGTNNMTDMQQHHSHSTAVTPPVAHIPMMTSHHSQAPQTGLIQYNSYIYNTGVISPYPTLFDMCPQ